MPLGGVIPFGAPEESQPPADSRLEGAVDAQGCHSDRKKKRKMGCQEPHEAEQGKTQSPAPGKEQIMHQYRLGTNSLWDKIWELHEPPLPHGSAVQPPAVKAEPALGCFGIKWLRNGIIPSAWCL